MKLEDKGTDNQAQIDEWKKIHGDIFSTTIDEQTVIFHKLKRKEYTAIMDSSPEEEGKEVSLWDRQEAIARAVVLCPVGEELESFIESKAGFATVIADEVIPRSGFNNTPIVQL